jgi:hypothetical protein
MIVMRRIDAPASIPRRSPVNFTGIPRILVPVNTSMPCTRSDTSARPSPVQEIFFDVLSDVTSETEHENLSGTISRAFSIRFMSSGGCFASAASSTFPE